MNCSFQVLIEAGSASSFEMSPRFSQNFSGAVTISGGGRHPSAASSSSGGGGGGGAGKGSKERIDLESELQEAMAENVGGGGGGGEDTLLDGECITTGLCTIPKKVENDVGCVNSLTWPEGARTRDHATKSSHFNQIMYAFEIPYACSSLDCFKTW